MLLRDCPVRVFRLLSGDDCRRKPDAKARARRAPYSKQDLSELRDKIVAKLDGVNFAHLPTLLVACGVIRQGDEKNNQALRHYRAASAIFFDLGWRRTRAKINGVDMKGWKRP